MRRVVVTGVGVVTPNGIGRHEFWKNCLAGRSGVGPIRSFDASALPVKVAAEVPEYDFSATVPESLRRSFKIMSRSARFGVTAAGLALQDSGLDLARENLERVGVVIGSGLVPMETAEIAPILAGVRNEQGKLDWQRFQMSGETALFPLWLLKYLPNMPAAHISLAYNLQGPNSTVTSACVAGTQAVGDGFRMIAADEADVVLAGGADSRLDPLLVLAYHALGTLSPGSRSPGELSRPFDRLRDGFVLGEGAAVLILEEAERAKRRGAIIFAEVLGYGSSFDAYSITKPHPDGAGAARAIKAALHEARVDPSRVDYINAHGTSTRLNDAMETAAAKRVFGERAKQVPMSSIKSMIGHAIGAAGAIEAAALALTLKEGTQPPTINLTCPDPLCDLDYIPNIARDAVTKIALSTSFGLGGQNGALVMAAV